MQHSAIEKLAYAQAAAHLLCGIGNTHDEWYQSYLDVVDAVDEGRKPGFEVWHLIEDESWDAVLGMIDDDAQSLLKLIKHTLGLVKNGLVHAAIEGELDSDMNAVDLSHLADIGAEISNEQAA